MRKERFAHILVKHRWLLGRKLLVGLKDHQFWTSPGRVYLIIIGLVNNNSSLFFTFDGLSITECHSVFSVVNDNESCWSSHQQRLSDEGWQIVTPVMWKMDISSFKKSQQQDSRKSSLINILNVYDCNDWDLTIADVVVISCRPCWLTFSNQTAKMTQI